MKERRGEDPIQPNNKYAQQKPNHVIYPFFSFRFSFRLPSPKGLYFFLSSNSRSMTEGIAFAILGNPLYSGGINHSGKLFLLFYFCFQFIRMTRYKAQHFYLIHAPIRCCRSFACLATCYSTLLDTCWRTDGHVPTTPLYTYIYIV